MKRSVELAYLPRKFTAPACVAEDNREITSLIGPMNKQHDLSIIKVLKQITMEVP